MDAYLLSEKLWEKNTIQGFLPANTTVGKLQKEESLMDSVNEPENHEKPLGPGTGSLGLLKEGSLNKFIFSWFWLPEHQDVSRAGASWGL